MDWKRLGKAALFPHIAVLLILLPLCTAGLVYAMVALEETDPVRIAFYALSFYTLVIWCARVPETVRFFKGFREENRYMKRWRSDPRLRIRMTLTGNVLWNGAYALLQLGMAVWHGSAWFYSLAAYYLSLAVMRFSLMRHTARHMPGERMRQELSRYRACGWSFLAVNLALSGMMLYMIREGRVTRHHEITTIAMAVYTFTSLTVAIVNVIRYRKYNSPVFSASKAISLAAACVSVLTLENTMLTTFGKDMERETQQLFLGLSGAAISAFILVMAICLIVHGSKKIKCMENEYGK